MLNALTEQMENGRWFASILECPGCWADGNTREESLDELIDVFCAWYSLKAQDKDDDLPTMDLIFTGDSK